MSCEFWQIGVVPKSLRGRSHRGSHIKMGQDTVNPVGRAGIIWIAAFISSFILALLPLAFCYARMHFPKPRHATLHTISLRRTKFAE